MDSQYCLQLASNITNGSAGSGIYAYTSDDYASYNLVGGVGTEAESGGGVIPSGEIASCQGFFAMSNATIIGANEIEFNNAMRLGSGGTTLGNSQFFKTKKSKNPVEKHRIWLNLSNAQGAFKQTLIGYVTGATNTNDSRFDGKSLDGNRFVDFYSVNQNEKLVIQGRALPFDENDEVSLGFKTAVRGVFTINIEKTDGVLANQAVFLEDKLTNTVFNLKKGDYTFNTEKGIFNNRFVLKYSHKTLGIEEFNAETGKVLVVNTNKQIKINSFSKKMDKVVIYDLSGKLIYEKNRVNNNELLIANLVSSHQVLIVKTSLQNGQISINKVVY